jgi:signal transduction histidine kinase
MDRQIDGLILHDFSKEIDQCRRILLGELKQRSLWFVRLRWLVPPAIVFVTVLAWIIGVKTEPGGLIGVAVFVAAYNVFFQLRGRRLGAQPGDDTTLFERFISHQICFDYGATFFLLHFTGGAASPFIFLFIFHVMFSAMLLTRRWACAFAGIAPAGIAVVGLLERAGWIPHHPILIRGSSIDIGEQPFQILLMIVFFAGFVLIAAFSVSAIMTLLRKRITDLADLSGAIADLNGRLESLMEERTRFMRKVAHNLRAPLSSVITMLEVLEGDHLGGVNADQRRYLDRVVRRVRSLTEMINELMILARSRTGARDTPWRKFSLGTVAGRISQTFQDEAKKKGLKFSVIAPGDLPEMRGDEEMIQELFENLVSNGIKYTPEQGEVSVLFSNGTNGFVDAEVRDTGIGIPAGEIPHLFKEFFRGSNVRDIIGTGLGLAIVKEVLDGHGGRIEVESEPGKGTTFRLRFPLDPPG